MPRSQRHGQLMLWKVKAEPRLECTSLSCETVKTNGQEGCCLPRSKSPHHTAHIVSHFPSRHDARVADVSRDLCVVMKCHGIGPASCGLDCANHCGCYAGFFFVEGCSVASTLATFTASGQRQQKVAALLLGLGLRALCRCLDFHSPSRRTFVFVWTVLFFHWKFYSGVGGGLNPKFPPSFPAASSQATVCITNYLTLSRRFPHLFPSHTSSNAFDSLILC